MKNYMVPYRIYKKIPDIYNIVNYIIYMYHKKHIFN